MKTIGEKANEYLDKISGDSLGSPINAAFSGFIAGYAEALRWRDPEVDPPTNQDVVLVKTDNNCYATAYYHGKASGFITYGEDAYVEFGEIIGWRPIE